MFLEILPDLVRGSTTTVFILLLLPVLSKTKLKTSTTLLLVSLVTIIDVATSTYFYLSHNYTAILYYSLAFYFLVALGFKYLYKDPFLQWLFNCVTVLNVYAIIVLASYYLAFLFPHPEYAVTTLRIVFFAITFFFFRKMLRPLYLEVSENWGTFVLPVIGILASYLYILLSLGDVESSMHENIYYFYFLTLVTILSYIAIFLSLKSLRVKFMLREENIKRQANEELLRSEIGAYENTLVAAKQTRHDIRHHNAIVAEYLNSNDLEGAKNYLQLYDSNIQDSALKDFSKNTVTNAVFRIYDRRAREYGINFVVNAEADPLLIERLPDIGIILSNIMENALTSCKQCRFPEKQISYTSTAQNGSILIEVCNSVERELQFEDNLPLTTKKGGGTGLLSVKNLVEKNHGMLDVRQEGQTILTRIILTL